MTPQKADFDPVPHLNTLSQLLEKEMDAFYRYYIIIISSIIIILFIID